MRRLLPLVAVITFAAPASAGELRVLPADVRLSGPRAFQALLLVEMEGGRVVADRTASAAFTSSDANTAAVEGNEVRPTADGSATLTARLPDGRTATAAVAVSGSKSPVKWSFRDHVVPVLTRLSCNSGACHGALAGKGGLKLSLRGYDPDADHFALTRQVGGRRVDTLRPELSLLLTKATRKMPHGGGQRMDEGDPDYDLLREWVANGSAGVAASEPALVKLEALPASALLTPSATLSVNVRAHYADGRIEDVTRWAKFVSSQDAVATVDEDGKATAAGPGEAAVSVLFADKVATVGVRVPHAAAVPAETFAKSPRHNYIDDHVLRKLGELNLPPSPQCDDHEFVRRAFLDAAGILPTAEEAAAFAADARPDKRARLIDSLLKRPEYVDYWAYRWSDLLLVSTRKLQQPATWAYYRSVRQAVADNTPWDQFARRVVTARGSTFDNGLGNYYAIHKDVAELTETTSVTFLGVSITCARCHNHPMEKWTQDQYWAFANMFARVGLKNGDKTGEVVVRAMPSGDVPHQRKGVPVAPAALDGPVLDMADPSDRREHFADWLTAPDNPYFAKAFVNRVWKNFMGRALVEADDDLRATNPPSNPELLDALANDFVKNGFDAKRLVRVIMMSAAYQRSGKPLPANEDDDRFYSHFLVKRLPAEVILDAYAQVTGVPTPFTDVSAGPTGGVKKSSDYPAGTRAVQLPDVQVVSRFLSAFGRPERIQSCSCERQSDASVSQALHLNNGQTLNDKLRSPKGRLESWLKGNVADAEAVRRVFLLALSREPTPAESRQLADALAGPADQRRQSLEDLFWAVLTSKEFLFNH